MVLFDRDQELSRSETEPLSWADAMEWSDAWSDANTSELGPIELELEPSELAPEIELALDDTAEVGASEVDAVEEYEASDGRMAAHELLSNEAESQLAASLQQAFTRLQLALGTDPQLLNALLDHIVAWVWPKAERRDGDDHQAQVCDALITHWDLWQVQCQLREVGEPLAITDEHGAVAEDQQHTVVDQQHIVTLLAELLPDRDYLIAQAEQWQHSALLEPELRRRLRACLQQILSARDQLTTANIRLVYHIAQGYRNKGVEFEDLVQEGIVGLMRAALKFDARAGTRFTTYAWWWIQQAIRKAITAQRSLIRYPAHVATAVNRLHGLIQDYRRAHGVEPDRAWLRRQTGWSDARIADLQSLTNLCVSASAPCFAEDGPRAMETLQDRLPAAEDDGTLTQVMVAEDQQRVESLLAQLPAREALIVRLRYGIGVKEAYSLNAVAPQLGLSRERVRQLTAEALARLRPQ